MLTSPFIYYLVSKINMYKKSSMAPSSKGKNRVFDALNSSLSGKIINCLNMTRITSLHFIILWENVLSQLGSYIQCKTLVLTGTSSGSSSAECLQILWESAFGDKNLISTHELIINWIQCFCWLSVRIITVLNNLVHAGVPMPSLNGKSTTGVETPLANARKS